MTKIAQASTTVEETVRQEQLQEIAKLRAELAALKSDTVEGLTTVRTADISGQTELKGVIENLESQLNLEHTSWEIDKRWYQSII